jgi:DNA primase
MRFDERLLDEIKARLRPSDVIGRTVKLRRQGREYVGLSPFTKEKTPSFYVNDDKGQFFDFSSGKTGDIITFLQETERLSFPEAVERLAAEAGVTLPTIDPRGAEEDKKRQGLQDWLTAAAAWFQAELRRPSGKEARAYLERRGLKEDEWARFGLGYAPEGRTRLKDYLVAKGAKPGELVESGVLIAPEEGGAPYDRFRERIMFPIADARGRIVSFGGRALDPDARAKYLNGPETPLFDKGRVLYGVPEARKLLHAAGEGAPLVVVEGYMDVIACQRAEIASVAPMGTALTESQMEQLWRLHRSPTLCFDADAAGQRAASRAIDRALPLLTPERTFAFASLDGGKDPDDVLRERGSAALKLQLTETKPLVAKLFEREKAEAMPLETPEQRAGLKVSLRRLAATIADRELAAEYRSVLLANYEALWPLSQPVYTHSGAGRALAKKRWEGRLRHPPLTPEVQDAVRRLPGTPKRLSAAIASALISDPVRIDDKIELLEVQGFCDPTLSSISKEIVHIRFQERSLEPETLRYQLKSRGFDELLKEIAKWAADLRAPFLSEDMPPDRARALWSHAFDVLVQIAALERALTEAKNDIEHFDMESFYRLKSERDALRRDIVSGAIWERLDPEPHPVRMH